MKLSRNHIVILIILLVLGVLIALYGISINLFFPKKVAYKDFMNYKVFYMGENCCSLWPLSHFILYTILAFFFPDNILFLFALGVAWEGIEMTGDIVISKFSKGKKQAEYSKKIQYGGNWIKGSFKDIIFNSAGLLLGFVLRKIYNKKEIRKR